MNKKGFTLVELLAVIVLLGVVALIATPIITGVIEDSRISSFKSSLNGLKKSIETDYGDNNFDSTVDYYYGGYNSGKTPSNTTKKLEVYDAHGNFLRDIEVSGYISGVGKGSVSNSGSVSVGIYTDKYCGILIGTETNVYIIGEDITLSECKSRINTI